MVRSLTSSQITALEADSIALAYAVDLTFYNTSDSTETAMHLWTGLGDLIASNGNTYTGVGDLLGVGGVEETSDFKANGIEIQLSGLTTDLVSRALGRAYVGRTATVYLKVNDSNELIEIFSGKMDELTLSDSPESSSASVKIEHVMIDLERTKPFRYTAQSHDVLFSGDTFFAYTQDLQDQQVEWGKK